MKKTVTLFLSLFMIFALSACGSQNSRNNAGDIQSDSQNTEAGIESTKAPAEEPAKAQAEELTGDSAEALTEASTEASTGDLTEAALEEPAEDIETAAGKTLVVYYSATGNTEEAANYIAAATGADLFELVPVEPYSSDDLNWSDDNSRVVYEHDNPEARDVELVESTVSDWESYDTIFIGYPIWWGIAAWPVDGFIKANDFTGKTVIPFCTSSSSSLGESGELLAEAAGTGNWLDGMRFSSRVSEGDVQNWIDSLGL